MTSALENSELDAKKDFDDDTDVGSRSEIATSASLIRAPDYILVNKNKKIKYRMNKGMDGHSA